jgi:hypothetical protein
VPAQTSKRLCFLKVACAIHVGSFPCAVRSVSPFDVLAGNLQGHRDRFARFDDPANHLLGGLV